MRTQTGVMIFALLAAACATSGSQGGGATRVFQADHKAPSPDLKDVEDEAERSTIRDAQVHASRADQAAASGNADQARAENRAAAEAFVGFLQRYPNSDWRMVIRRMAAERFLMAQAGQEAALQAEKLVADPAANDTTRAIGARFAAGGWQASAAAETRAGRLDPLRIVSGEQRKEPPKPRPLPDVWKRFIENTDTYLKYQAADPLAKLPGEEAARQGGVNVPRLALIAAQVEYAHDNLEDARRRLDTILSTWPGSPEAPDAAALYLQTFLALKDDAGFQAAVDRVQTVLAPEAKKAADAAQAPNATEEQKKHAEQVTAWMQELARQKQGAGFLAAQKLLDAGKPAEAAAAFEKFASENKGHPDAPGALFNAAVAWDKAGDRKKADADREQLIAAFPDSVKVTPLAVLTLAVSASRAGDHAAAEHRYSDYLKKWPQGAQRCIALQNIGIELEKLKRRLDAAERYRAFGTDEKCAKDDPNAAAAALYHSGEIFAAAQRRSDAKQAWTALVSLQGVTATAARTQIEEARRKLKALK